MTSCATIAGGALKMTSAALFALLSAGLAGVLAAATALKAGKSAPRWAFVAGMLVLAAETATGAGSATAANVDHAAAWQEWRLLALSCVPAAWLWFSATYARGNSRLSAWRDRIPAMVAIALPILVLGFREHLFVNTTSAPHGNHVFRLDWPGKLLFAGVLVGSVIVVMNVERTFRAAVGTIRWQIKFMLLGVGTLFVARIFTTSQTLVFGGFDAWLDSINSIALLVGGGLTVRSLLRTGHFELDVYPSQSVLQNSVTVLLAGIYLVTLGLLAKAVSYFGGDGAFVIKALLVLVGLVGLALLMQSDHVRLRLRKFVSRHFQRPFHDYRTIWQKFAAATATRVERTDLSRAIVTLIAEQFAALSVSLWLINDQRDGLVLAASTSKGDASGSATTLGADGANLLTGLGRRVDPFDLDAVHDDWTAALRECHPRLFANGGNRACVPLRSRGELLGVILIGDRVGGGAVSLQDLEILKCLGEHAAACLMNAQLSHRLMQNRELEAFQAMAAFFVHDLKNAASTLNLMLQNLPAHFDNPEFRADAFRGVAKTVTHINRLIGRLTALRHELKTELADADLNEVVQEVLAGVDTGGGPTLVKEIVPLPRLPLDREQFHKVVTNLVLNATEAVPRDGRVRVATARQDGWAVLTVEDNGCGMSEEFMNRALFRPFQTTKKSGLGIGMFQSKMIVEAHGGRIAVASQPGRGTTFQVFLRAPQSAGQPN